MFAGEEAYTPLDRLPGHFVMLMVHSSTFFGITRITKALAKKILLATSLSVTCSEKGAFPQEGTGG